MIKKLIDILSRWWQRKGFGIQSRTDYDFLHDVIREKYSYYIYHDIQNLFPDATMKEHLSAQLLFRIGNYAHPTEIAFHGAPSSINKYALNHTIRNSDLSVKFTFIQGEPVDDVYANIATSQFIVVTDIDKTNNSLWNDIQANPHAITFDISHTGIAIIDRKRYAQHYFI